MQEALALAAARRTIEQSIRLPVHHEAAADPTIDGYFRVGGTTFAVEVKSNARGATVSQAVAALRAFCDDQHPEALLLVVPFMGETGAEICERFGVNWVDLHGNASIDEDNIHVFIRGRRKRGQDHVPDSTSGVNPFGRKAARVVHCLLTNPKRAWTRSDLENNTNLDKGYISKILAELSEHDYVRETFRERRSEVRVVHPMVLLDAWNENYKKLAPMTWGLIASHGGADTARALAEIFSSAGVTYALTGLAAAAEYSAFGTFRRVDAYVADVLPDSAEYRLHAGNESRGRNVAVYLDAESATIGAVDSAGARFASPVLTYLDLAQLPERSDEARGEMRRYLEERWK
jgi:hypothetical protein